MKAERYAAECHPRFVEFVTKELPSWSYKTAREFYRDVYPTLNEAHQRFLTANDRFFLLTVACKRKDAIHEWLYDRCREVEFAPDDHLDLWARYHYKSTIITFAGSIQEIINDPEITIAIFSHTARLARRFLSQIKEELEKNEDLKRLFPDVFYGNPKKESPAWSLTDGIVVKRKSNPKELTVQAFGLIDGLPTGGHWRLLIFNDVVTQDSVTQTDTEQPKKTWLAWEQAQNLGTHEKNRRWHEGTRYSYADAYGHMLAENILKARIYPATHDGTLRGRPVFLSQEKWEQIKRDQRLTLPAQQLLNPLAGEENTFLVTWLRPYELRPQNLTVWILIDAAGNKPGNSKSDNTAIIVIGMDPNSNFYLLDGYCHRMKLSERTEKYLTLNEKWRTAPGVQIVRTGYERYGAMTDVEHIEIDARRRNQEGVSIEEVNWVREGSQSKKARIARLEPDFRESRFWLPKYIHVNGVGTCTWHVEVQTQEVMRGDQPVIDKLTGKPLFEEIEGSAKIVTTPYRGPTKAETTAERDGEKYRILAPLRRMDADGNVYDLTRLIFEEFRLHPFGAHEDALDATSRIKDMDPMPPMRVDTMATSSARAESRHPDD